MANKLISQMGLPRSISNVFAARNIMTAKDALSMTEFELMTLLDVGLEEVRSAVAGISEAVSPPHQTALELMKKRGSGECSAGHLPTTLRGLDDALCGGVPFGCLTELVGPAGIGKTQLSLLAALPLSFGGLNGRVVYIDTESKFSSRRVIEIGKNSFPQIFHSEGMVKEMAGRIVVMRPSTLSEFTDSLQQIKLSLLEHEVKLLIIDSMAALSARSLAELSQVPIVVTNQVRSQKNNDSYHYTFEERSRNSSTNAENFDFHLVAALGVQWAHAVTIRLILEAHSGQKFIKVAKSPISPPVAFPFVVDGSGVSLLSDEGVVVMGSGINAIRSKDHSILTGEGNHRY